MKTLSLRSYVVPGAAAFSLLLTLASATAVMKAMPNSTNAAPANDAAPVAKALPTPPNLTPAAPVNSPATPTGEDIREIRQARHEPTLWTWFVIVAGVVTLSAAVFGVRHWLHHGKFFEMSPSEIALQRLEEALRLMDPDQARDYCFEVSKTIRNYIEDQLHQRAPRLTTEEFLRELVEGQEAIFASHRALLDDFLQHCDLAKFAGWRYSREALANMHVSAIKFVQQSSVTPAKAASTYTLATPGPSTVNSTSTTPSPARTLVNKV